MPASVPVSLPFRLASLLLVLVSLACTGCRREQATPAGPETLFPLQIGSRTLHAWVAVTPAEQQRGLMFRQELPADTGMLFVFPAAERRAFWMRNTPLPLDIGYFAADGTLRSIHQLYPYDERSVPSASSDIQFALEMAQGWFAAAGIRPGDKLDLAAVRAAVHARGSAGASLLPTLPASR